MKPEVEAELHRLYKVHDGLFPDKIVAAAKKDSSPLHGEFTWDDSAAAHQHRLNEARYLIREVKIVVHQEPDKVVKVRGFVSVTDHGERKYMPTRAALIDHRDQVLEELMRDIETLRRKYANLVDFDDALRRALDRSQAA